VPDGATRDDSTSDDSIRDHSIRVVLLDIEGTTTPVDFVTGVLFPFARSHVRAFLEQHASEDEVRGDLQALLAEHHRESSGPEKPPARHEQPASARIDSAVGFVHWLMDRDRKTTALKSLQGRIWQDGYRTGALRGQVYPDVRPALERWRLQARRCAIFSSGSVLAQKLLFATTPDGDLARWIDAYFDTNIGAKRERESYERIAAELNEGKASVLFISDVAAELDAARQAGMRTALCVREGELPRADHTLIHSLDVVFPD
jgi:enolase-phosphatase E1